MLMTMQHLIFLSHREGEDASQCARMRRRTSVNQDEVFTDDYSEKNLRTVIRQALQTIDATERPTTLQKLSEKSFGSIMQTTAKPIVVQLFYTRLHVAYLEQLLAHGTVSQFV